MDNMLSKALRDFLSGPLNQLIVNISGDKDKVWEKELKLFLRKRPCWQGDTVNWIFQTEGHDCCSGTLTSLGMLHVGTELYKKISEFRFTNRPGLIVDNKFIKSFGSQVDLSDVRPRFRVFENTTYDSQKKVMDNLTHSFFSQPEEVKFLIAALVLSQENGKRGPLSRHQNNHFYVVGESLRTVLVTWNANVKVWKVELSDWKSKPEIIFTDG